MERVEVGVTHGHPSAELVWVMGDPVLGQGPKQSRHVLGRWPEGLCSACGRLWQFAHPRPLSLLQRGLAPRSKGRARAELRPARRHSRLPHSRSLLLPGRER